MKYTLSFLLIAMLFIFSCENSSDPLAVNNEQTDIAITDLPGPILPPPPPPPPPSKVCVRTPGFWKNHPDAWPVEVLTLGGVELMKPDIIVILNTPEKGDKSFTIFRALVAAKLNELSGANVSCIDDVMYMADKWLYFNAQGSNVKGSSIEWKNGELLYLELDDYNNGLLCAPACD